MKNNNKIITMTLASILLLFSCTNSSKISSGNKAISTEEIGELNGDWILSSINNGPVNRMVILPTLNIDLSKMRLSANGGCNYLSGGIDSISKSSIAISPMISTLKACIEPNIESEFSLAISQIKTYEVKSSMLTFMNEKGEKVLSFIKGQPKSSVPQQLQDIWAVTKINGNPINTKNPIPDMEINLTTMKIMGTNGCNRYSGTIDNVSDSKIHFGPVATTRMMCENMETPNLFDAVLSIIVSYKREELQLMFFDEVGKEVLTLKKVD
jgi:heat shock protein HslJ